MNKESLLEYFDGDELAATSWREKYALKSKDGQLLENSPDDMHRRLAKEFARIEYKYISQLLNTSKDQIQIMNSKLSEYGQMRLAKILQSTSIDDIAESIFALFRNFEYIIPGGSVMSGLGSEKPVSLSNCFVIDSPEDNIESIVNTARDMAQIYKRRGGVGIDISKLRPNKSYVHNAANTSSGSVSFMSLYSMLTQIIGQDGRRGALLISEDINHPDVLEFINSKRNLAVLTGANISVRNNDNFMYAVEANQDYILSWSPSGIRSVEYDNLEWIKEIKKTHDYDVLFSYGEDYLKIVKAADLWKELIHSAWLSAEPGIFNWDTLINNDPTGVYKRLCPISTNPCQPSWATVLTKDGIRTFADINIGDEIWSSEGWATIIKKETSGIKDVYEYRTTAGSFYGTDTHRVISNGDKVEAKNAETIDILAGNKNHNIIPFNYQDIMDGLVIGDGSVHKASNDLIYLCIGENDSDYLLSDVKNLIKKHREGIKSYAYEVSTTITKEELPLTYLRNIPDRFFFGDSNKVRCFLKGLFSANGSIVNKRVTLKTSSPKLRDQVQIMLSSVGIRSYYTTNKSKDVDFSNGAYICRESYDINISTDREIFYHSIGFLQKYKMEALRESIGKLSSLNKTHSITDIEWISKEPVYNITVDNASHTYWTGGLNVSNCGELGLSPNDSCRLIASNLYSLVQYPFTPNACINTTNAYAIFYMCQIYADDLVDLELEAINSILNKIRPDCKLGIPNSEYELWKTIKQMGELGRRTGTGITGVADLCAALNVPYGDPETMELIFNIKFKAEIDASVDLAILRGTFPLYNAEVEALTEDNHNTTHKWYSKLATLYPEGYNRMCNHGRRNAGLSTVAPTGTISILAGVTSGIEPLFLPFYKRRKVCNNTESYDYIDNNGVTYNEYLVIHPKFKKWINIKYPEIKDLTTVDLDKLFEESPWYNQTADKISWEKRVSTQGIIQKYISSSISSTVNVPKNTPESTIANIYNRAWNLGLKGITVYREGSRSGILTRIDEETSNAIITNRAPKRPKELVGEYYQVKIKGEQFIVIVGLLDNTPYELFAFRPLRPVNLVPHTGKVTKVKKMCYRFESKYITLANIELAIDNVLERTITLDVSMSLRHGIPIKYIIKNLKKGDDNITSFSSAICRILSKYMKKEEVEGEVCPECGGKLIRENGCIHCGDCTYSKCG